MARNPYAAPTAPVTDTPRSRVPSFPLRVMRAIAVLGNGALVLLPVFYLFSPARPDLGYFLISGYCIILATVSTVALVSGVRERLFFAGAVLINILVVLLFAYLLYDLFARDMGSTWNARAILFLLAPVLLNLVTVLLVRRSRTRLTNAIAA